MATSAGFHITEGPALATAVTNPASALSNGVVVAGVKYMPVKAVVGSIIAKKGTSGVVCGKGGTAIVVAVFDEKLSLAKATDAVDKLAHKIEFGY
uniref:Profilin n=1 Tax=Arcella intermedia TaxID=1963864 RepID=A0A6B2LTM6_9EUKA